MLSYDEFRRRLPIAAKENSEHQEATEMSPKAMMKARDKENCFRIVELGIPACDVVIVGKPRLEYSDNGKPLIVIGEPDQPTYYDKERFNFRILRGHTIKNLLKMRRATK